MKMGLISICAFWSLSIGIHFYRLFLYKKYLKLKSEESLINDSKNNYKRYSITFFETYLRGLNRGKWFLFILGILSFIRMTFFK